MSADVIDAFGHREFIRSCTNYVKQLGLSADGRGYPFDRIRTKSGKDVHKGGNLLKCRGIYNMHC